MKIREVAEGHAGVGFFERDGLVYRRWTPPGHGEEYEIEQLVLPKACRMELLELDTANTVVAVAFVVQNASIHFECESIKIKNIFPNRGPAKSRCSLDHGRDGHFHRCNGAAGGLDWVDWHSPHF